MTVATEIRASSKSDAPAIEALYPAAFPDEDLLPLVRSLSPDTDSVVSLVAAIGTEIAGNIIFTIGGVAGTSAKAALLGPLAVRPAWQRQGVGSELVHAGLVAMRDAGVDVVCVLGDPAYYGRFGFVAEANIEPPYALPAEWRDAWQSLYPGSDPAAVAGALTLPSQWLEPALWLP